MTVIIHVEPRPPMYTVRELREYKQAGDSLRIFVEYIQDMEDN